MIQRKQTLFLFQLIFLGITLLFISSNTVDTASGNTEVFLIPIKNDLFNSTLGHMAAIALNFIGLILTFTTIFLYKNRDLQVKLCYVLIVLWLLIGLMIAFCPFVTKNENILSVNIHYFACLIALFAIVSAYFAAKFIKKDI